VFVVTACLYKDCIIARIMRTILLCATQLCATSLLLISMSGCGGSGATGSGGSGKDILYATDTNDDVFSFSIDPSTGAVTQAAAITLGGEAPGHYSQLAVTPSGSFVYTSTQLGLEINGYSTNSSGALSPISVAPFPVLPSTPLLGIDAFAIDPEGKFLYGSAEYGPTPIGSEYVAGIAGLTIDRTSGNLTPIPGGLSTVSGGRLQWIVIDPTGRFLYGSSIVDSPVPGHNIWGYTIDSGSGVLTAMPGSPFATSQNSQPFVMCVDPMGKFLYVALSNAGSIAAFTIDSSTGALTPVANSPFPTASTPDTQTYELTISPSGKFLYAFNYNGNSIAAFTINSTNGELSTVSGSPFFVNPPGQGQLIVDPSEKFLYVADGSSSAAFIVFDIDQNTGALSPDPISPIVGSQEPFGLAVVKFQ
jgi:6-phosphogluconolactonase